MLDQSQSSWNLGAPLREAWPGRSYYPVGQSFTAGITGWLTEVDLRLNGADPTPMRWTLTLRDGDGYYGELLATWQVTVSASWPAGDVALVLPDPAALQAGHQYTVLVTALDNADAEQRGLLASSANPYAGGRFWGGSPYGGFGAGADLVFATKMLPRPRDLTGDDTLFGTPGADTIDGFTGNDSVRGAAGADSLLGGLGNDTLLGGEGDDTLAGGDGADQLQGDTGNDSLLGDGGDDTLAGGDGADRLRGGDGADSLQGGLGNDTLLGEGGSDTLTGGDGADRLFGGAGNDLLLGGAGWDRLQGDAGNDTLTGGGGNDTFLFGPGGGFDRITDFNPAQDRIELLGGLTVFGIGTLGGHALVVLADGGAIEVAGGAPVIQEGSGLPPADPGPGGELTDQSQSAWNSALPARKLPTYIGEPELNTPVGQSFTAGDSGVLSRIDFRSNGGIEGTGTFTVELRAGDGLTGALLAGWTSSVVNSAADPTIRLVLPDPVDVLAGQAYTVLVTGVWERDAGLRGLLVASNNPYAGGQAYAGPFYPHITASKAWDFVFATHVLPLIRGTAGNDTLTGIGNAETIDGADGNDSLRGGAGTDTLLGGTGNDTLLGEAGNDVLEGGDGADRLFGGAGNDVLRGGAGADRLVGEAGNDTLAGGAGNDVFAFGANSGVDRILDFDPARDRIDLLGTQAVAAIGALGGNALIVLAEGGVIELAGIAPAAVSMTWFV